jgi:hypothetical protein
MWPLLIVPTAAAPVAIAAAVAVVVVVAIAIVVDYHLMVKRFSLPNDLKRYAGGSISSWQAIQVRQVRGWGPDEI